MRLRFGLSPKVLGRTEYQRVRRNMVRKAGLCLFCLGPNDRNALACSECANVHRIKATQ